MGRNKSMGKLIQTKGSEYTSRKKFDNIESPTRKLIELHEKRLNIFDINKIWRWTSENIKKFKFYI